MNRFMPWLRHHDAINIGGVIAFHTGWVECRRIANPRAGLDPKAMVALPIDVPQSRHSGSALWKRMRGTGRRAQRPTTTHKEHLVARGQPRATSQPMILHAVPKTHSSDDAYCTP
jgi:hypothetical protein